jgi:hypothetical protein
MVYHLLVEDSVDWVALRGAELKDAEQNALFVALEERYNRRGGSVKSKMAGKVVKTKGGGKELHTPEQIIPLKITIGQKRAMEVLCETIQLQGRKPPRLRLKNDRPVDDFVLAMYADIAKWSIKHMIDFITKCTGDAPTELEAPLLMGDVKRIFHEMFGHEEAEDADLKDPASVWKMWPHVRSKRTDETEEDDVMQTQTSESTGRRSKFSGKASAPAKAAKAPKADKATKKAAAAPAEKKLDPATKKKSAKAGVEDVTRIRLPGDARLEFVKDPVKKGARQELADALKVKSIKTLDHLIAKMKTAKWDEKTTRNFTNKLIRGGCVRVIS